MAEERAKTGGPKKRQHQWKPSPECQALILSTWGPIDITTIETPLEVIERNMVFFSTLGTRTLEAAAALKDKLNERVEAGYVPKAADFRDIDHLMDMGVGYRKQAEKSAALALPYRQPKLNAIAAPDENEQDMGTPTDAHGAPAPVIDDISRTLAKVKAKTEKAA